MDYEEQDDNIISEGAEYSAKSEFSKPRLVEESVKKCIEARSKEMIAGYYNYKFDKDGVPLKIWIPDQREIYNACVEALRNLLSPEIKKNENYKKVETNLKAEYDILFNEYSYEETTPEYNGENRLTYKTTGNKYIPKKGEKVCIKKIASGSRIVMEEKIGGWDRKIDFYLDGLVDINDKLFCALNELVDSLNYFKQQARF